MLIDLFVLLAVILAIVKGSGKGFIMALFNTVSLVIGLAAAVKLSASVAPFFSEHFGGASKYAPLLAFVAVFVVALVIVRFAGKAVEKTLETMKIGFLNRIGGVVLYLLFYLSLASILFYYMDKMGFLSDELIQESYTYGWIAPWGPAVLDGIGYLVPFFKDMFEELNVFFERIGNDPGLPT